MFARRQFSHRFGVPGLVILMAIATSTGLFAAPLASAGKILFLHHSTGEVIWGGGVPEWFAKYNSSHQTGYTISELAFPKDEPYGWKNYPYDYWNIWVSHAGNSPFMGEPTLEMLTKDYQVIVFKHCFPVSDVEPDPENPDVTSEDKTPANYKLQYLALKEKLRSFPGTQFLVWTGAAQVKGATTTEQATRAKSFFDWMKTEWDEKGDNIFVWDFHALEVEGGIFLKGNNAAGPEDSHPNEKFARKVAPFLCQRIMDVISGKADSTAITGKPN